MVGSEFDSVEWIHRLAEELDKVAAGVATSSRHSLGPSSPGSTDGDQLEYSRDGRALETQAKSDTSAFHAFKGSRVELEFDSIRAKAVLREHPLLARGIVGLGSDDGVVFARFSEPFVSSLNSLVEHLARLSVQEDGTYAAKLLNDFLAAGAKAELPGSEIVILHGLRVERHLDLGRGAYLAPYREVKEEFDLPDEPEDWFTRIRWPRLPSSPAGSACALVRSFVWGPGILIPGDGPDGSNKADGTKVRYSFPRDCEANSHRYSEEPFLLVALLSIKLKWPLVSNTAFVRTAKRLEKIDRNFACAVRHGHINLGDIGPKPYQVSQGEADAFVEFADNWCSYPERDRDPVNLAIRRLAVSFNRNFGFFHFVDRILDVAIALEIMYGSPKNRITGKLCKRAEALLGHPDDCERVSNAMRRFYDARSRLVHGRERIEEDATEFVRLLEEGQDLACLTLERLFANGPISDWGRFVVDSRLAQT